MAAEYEQPARSEPAESAPPGASNGSAEQRPGSQPGPASATLAKPRMPWSRRIEKLILSIFCLEVGGFLLVFPWMTYWNDNFFFTFAEQLRPVFLSPYFRGAISGLGALNLYLAVVESIDFLGSFLD